MLNRTLLFAAILTLSAIAADNPSREVTYPSADDCRRGGCPTFFVDKGYVFYLMNYVGAPANGLTVFDPTGRIDYQVDITAPDGTPGHLPARAETLAIDTDGTVLVPLSYGGYGGNGHVKGGGIAVLDKDGKQIRFVDTARFLPEAACFGPDHSIWIIGTQYTPLRDDDPIDHVQRADYGLVRKYSPDGKQLGSFLPRSLFPPGMPPAEAGWMRASRDRIGIMTHPGQDSNNPEWVELDPDGKLMGRWKLGPQSKADAETHNMTYSLGSSYAAFTADGRLFAQTESCPVLHRCSYQLVFLDRTTSTWKASDHNPVDVIHQLVGADGNDLILWDRSSTNTAGVHLQWFQPGQ